MKLQLPSWATRLGTRASPSSPPLWHTGIASASVRSKRYYFRMTAPLSFAHPRATSTILQHVRAAHCSTSVGPSSPSKLSSASETSSAVHSGANTENTQHGSLNAPLSTPPRLHRDPWTPEEDKEIEKLFLKGLSMSEIARELGRTEMALRRHMASIRISSRMFRKKTWKLAQRRMGYQTGFQFKLALSSELARSPEHFRSFLQNLRTKKYTSREDQWSMTEDEALLQGYSQGVPIALIKEKHFSQSRSETALYSRVCLLRRQWSDRLALALENAAKQEPPTDGTKQDNP